ncbi:MAG TPA: DUF2330 domain-containing protein [Ktedonobacteraceae bacterium]|nr:DUF2330 domain-containing protein [Ktedonobacteraceae bacterium]
MLKRFAILVFALAFFVLQAQSAFACGGLVAPDGEVRLSRATTLVAWHNGNEHYLTTFQYQGNISRLGWIVPLPAVPLNIVEGGAWTLQRLELETHPQPLVFDDQIHAASSAAVLERVKIEALNITVIRGSGPEVINWATSNGFVLNGDTTSHLLIYAKGSPIFMAAQFDTGAARARGEQSGDGTPILITMKTAHIWVPLEVLALDGQPVQADLYMLTDQPVYTSDLNAALGQSSVGSGIPDAQGFTLAFQEQMNSSLYHDLSTDRNMGWVWPDSWLTYLTLDAPNTTVTYDLGVSSSGIIHLAPFGTAPMAVADNQAAHDLPAWLPRLPLGTPQVLLGLLIVLCLAGGIFLIVRSKRLSRAQKVQAAP